MEISKLKDLLGDIPETETKKLNVYVKFEKRVSEFSYQITDDSGAVFTLDLTNSRQKSDSFEGKWGKCLSVMKHGDKCLQANSNSYILEDKQKTEVSNQKYQQCSHLLLRPTVFHTPPGHQL